MSLSPHIEDSRCYCFDCKKELHFNDFEVVNAYTQWRCPYCGGDVHVYAHTEDWNYELIRKNVKDIKEGDLIFMTTDRHRNSKNEVLNKSKNGDKIKLAIKEYRSVNLSPDAHLDCINGTWDHYPNFEK